MTQLIAPVLLAWLSPLKGKRQISVTINAPIMLQIHFNFHDVAFQTQSTLSWLSQTCFPTVLPLLGQYVISLIPQGQRVKPFFLFLRKTATISDNTKLTRNQLITSEERVSQQTPISSPGSGISTSDSLPPLTE